MIKGYKKTNVLTVDKVAACIYHYEKLHRPLSKIYLDRQHWEIFKRYAEQVAPECCVNDEIDFEGVIVAKGSSLQTKDMYWEYKVRGEA